MTRPESGPYLTIGQLAKRIGMRPSALRFYEAEGLLTPASHTPAGYRLYTAASETTLRLIQRAQRVGFTLADIRQLLAAQDDGQLTDADALAVAEARYRMLERQLTPLLVQQHELGLFLTELRADLTASGRTGNLAALDRLLSHVCVQPADEAAETLLDRLLVAQDCALRSVDGVGLLDRLRGVHVHLWTEPETYAILVVSQEPLVHAAVAELLELERSCGVHAETGGGPRAQRTDEGVLISAPEPNGYLFARLFLALEHESAKLKVQS